MTPSGTCSYGNQLNRPLMSSYIFTLATTVPDSTPPLKGPSIFYLAKLCTVNCLLIGYYVRARMNG